MRFALRQLAKTPGFTVVALLTLALGIGANTAIFSLVKSVLLQPFPYPHQEQLAILWEDESDFQQASIAWPDLVDWQRDNTAFSALAGYRRDNFTLTGRGEPEMLRGARVNAAMFDVIQLPPLRGRYFTPAEDKVGAPGLVVLGYALWQRKFGGSDEVLGQTVTLNGGPHTVIGVMPREFGTPSRVDFLTQIGRISDEKSWQTRDNHPGIYALGRMKPGQTFDTALADLRRISARIEKESPETSTGVRASGQLLFENAVGSYRRGIWLLFGAVALVLLIACANLANLILARNASRESEFAVRAALGASRGRIVRQLLVESLLLALGGGVLGALLAGWARQGIVALAPAGIARFQQVRIDGGVLAVTCALSLVTALIFGLWPAWKSARPDLRNALAAGGRTGSDTPATARARELLIVAEVAITLVLLVGAGLLLRSFARAQAANLGFDARNILTLRLDLPEKSYPTAETRGVFFERLVERVAALPGVVHADAATNSPLDTGWQTSWHVPGTPEWPPGKSPLAEMNVVSDTYFQTLGIPLLRGRAFDRTDSPTAPPAVIIDQSFADRAWPGRDPIGQKLEIHVDEKNTPATVVGVVPTLKVYGYATEPKLAQAYLSVRQSRPPFAMLLVRGERDAKALLPAVRRAVGEIDPDRPLWDVRTLEERVNDSFSQPRLYSYLLAIFAGLALLLATVGLYGVLAFQVSRRTREFGIRIALGALHGQILTLVLRRGLRLLATGVLLGLAGALALGKVLGTLLYRTSAFDAQVIGAVTGLLAAIALLACWLPARRATRVNPIAALRAE